MCAALQPRGQSHHPGLLHRGGAAAGPDDRERRRPARRRAKLRTDSRLSPRQQSARDERERGAGKDDHSDYQQRHRGAPGLPAAASVYSRRRGQPVALPPSGAARRWTRISRSSSCVPAGRATLPSTTPTAPDACWPPSSESAKPRRELNDAGLASLDLVRRYGDRWERPLLYSRSGRELVRLGFRADVRDAARLDAYPVLAQFHERRVTLVPVHA